MPRSAPGSATGSPSTTIRPTVDDTNPATALRTVVLPQPDGPRSATNSPGVVSKVNRRTASTRRSPAPNVMPRSVISIRPVGAPFTATASPSLFLARQPRHAPGAGPADERAREHAEHADRQHPDDDLRVLHDAVGDPREVADAELAGDHLGGDQTDPRHAHADRQPRHDRRQGAGQHDLAEDRGAAGAEAGGGADELAVDSLDAVDRLQHDRKERAEGGDEDDTRALGGPEHDADRHPRH